MNPSAHFLRRSNLNSISNAILLLCAFLGGSPLAQAQAYGEPDHGAPGDAMIQKYLRAATEQIETNFLKGVQSEEEWTRLMPQFHQQYFEMLGLWPLPEKTPLEPTITHTLDRGDYLVDMIYYQSQPGLYVTGNLYRPAKVAPGERLPAILYVCGHSPRGRNGNKTAYQSHGIWFARHGYVCLTIDTIEMGELTCTHHGTYREGRWWWLSRGYTPAGVECWNGIRGIDYLVSRPDVDPDRIGVTGISGGGAATVWISAADKRVKAAAPVSGWSDLRAHVSNRVINGHCDCMFLYNTYQWPFARVPSLIAPRPLLFMNSDSDSIFPMDGNERTINRLERVYSLLGAGDFVDSLVSMGGHAYRRDIRQAEFRFFNTYLKNDPRPVFDSEVDLVTTRPTEVHPLDPEQLRVFQTDFDFPAGAINSRIDYEFVPMGKPGLPGPGEFDTWKNGLLANLRRLSFHHFPAAIPNAVPVETSDSGVTRVRTESVITIPLKPLQTPPNPPRVWLFVANSNLDESLPAWLSACARAEDSIYICEPRGLGSTRWTTRNPPNYVERSHYLLGRTVDSGRIWDIASVAGYLKNSIAGDATVYVAGQGAGAVLAAYAALLSPEIEGLALSEPPATHMDSSAPALLNVLRVCDIPDAIGMLAPRPVTLRAAPPEVTERAGAVYKAAGASKKLVVQP